MPGSTCRALRGVVSITHTRKIATTPVTSHRTGLGTAASRAVSMTAISLLLVGCPQIMNDDFVISGLDPSGGRTTLSQGGTTAGVSDTSIESGGRAPGSATTQGELGGVPNESSAVGGAMPKGGAGSGGNTPNASTCTTCDRCAEEFLSEPSPITSSEPLDVDWVLYSPSLSPDGLTLYFAAASSSGSREQLVRATRTSLDSLEFSHVELVFPNATDNRGTPFLSPDGLTLYFYSMQRGLTGDRDIWVMTRTSLDAEFSNMELVPGGLNTPRLEHLPSLSPDQLTIYYGTYSTRPPENADIWRATRASVTGAFANPVAVTDLNSNYYEGRVAFTPDGSVVYFSSSRVMADEPSQIDIWRATLSAEGGKFVNHQRVSNPGVNSASTETDVTLTANGRELFFISNRSGKYWIYRSLRSCK